MVGYDKEDMIRAGFFGFALCFVIMGLILVLYSQTLYNKSELYISGCGDYNEKSGKFELVNHRKVNNGL
ncbi:MAG: hypothetical protein GY861_11245 [bacterium]|nr:hypothetical protein [bacterium]